MRHNCFHRGHLTTLIDIRKPFKKVCIVIRFLENRRDGTSELTWKPPASGEIREVKQFWKEEINFEIGKQIEPMKRILEMLGFITYGVVEKTRREFRYDRQTSVCLDVV